MFWQIFYTNSNGYYDKWPISFEVYIYCTIFNHCVSDHAALICLAVFPFILYWVCYTHCKITELQKLEHAQTSQMSKFNSELDALRKELETLKQLTTNDGESNEVSGRKSIWNARVLTLLINKY
jgi:hypothetical protein